MPAVVLIYATRRPDLTESVVAVARNDDEARYQSKRLTKALGAEVVRLRVKPADLTPEELAAIVEQWGREDAAAGHQRQDAELLPDEYRDAYRRGFRAAARPG